MNKFFQCIAFITLGGALGLLALIGYWLWYPYNPVEFKNAPFKLINPIVKTGEHLEYRVSYCKNVSIGGKVSRSFVDGIIYSTPDLETNIDKGCHENTVSVYVPRALPPGNFTIKTVYRYQVNPIRVIDVIVYTEPFAIIK